VRITNLPGPKPYKSHRSRRFIQALGLLAAVLIGLRHVMPGESTGGSLDAFCPFGGVETLFPYLLTGRTLATTNLLNFSLLLGVVGVSLTAGRAFCGWMCPLGTIQDTLAGWARRASGDAHHVHGKHSPARLPLRVPASIDRPLRYAKYVLLAVILAASIFTALPPAHSICPVRAFFAFHLTGLLVLVLLSFVGLSLLVERGVCRFLCPLAALLAPLNRIAPVHLKSALSCSHCQRCDQECPMGIQDVPDNLRHSECIRCLECLDTCARKDALHLNVG
jgi:polyferredoxin